MRLHVVCLSDCLSIPWSHIGWNSWKIISRPNSLRPMRLLHQIAQQDIIILMALYPKFPKPLKSPKIDVLDNPTLIWRPRQEEPPRTCALYFQQLESLAYIFVTDSIGLSLFKFVLGVGSKRCIFSALECVLAVQGHPRSMILVPIESAFAACILHRFCR